MKIKFLCFINVQPSAVFAGTGIPWSLKGIMVIIEHYIQCLPLTRIFTNSQFRLRFYFDLRVSLLPSHSVDIDTHFFFTQGTNLCLIYLQCCKFVHRFLEFSYLIQNLKVFRRSRQCWVQSYVRSGHHKLVDVKLIGPWAEIW